MYLKARAIEVLNHASSQFATFQKLWREFVATVSEKRPGLDCLPIIYPANDQSFEFDWVGERLFGRFVMRWQEPLWVAFIEYGVVQQLPTGPFRKPLFGVEFNAVGLTRSDISIRGDGAGFIHYNMIIKLQESFRADTKLPDPMAGTE